MIATKSGRYPKGQQKLKSTEASEIRGKIQQAQLCS